MAAQAGAGIEGLEAERLCLGRVDDFVDIDAHPHAELLELVDQRDVDAAVDVFKQLGHLGDRGAADLDDAAEDGAIEGRSQLRGCRAAAADDLGNVVPGDGVVAGIFALGRKGDVDAGLLEGARNLEPEPIAGFKHGRNNLFGGAGISGALEDDQLVLMNVRRERGNGAGDVAQVGLVVLVERGGHADDDGIHGGDFRVVGGGSEAGFLGLLNLGGQDAHNIGAAGVEFGDLVGGNVEAGHLEAFAAEQQRQRQPDIAHPNNPDAGFTGFDLLLQAAQGSCCRSC